MKTTKTIRTKMYKNMKSGSIRTITFKGKSIKQIYINNEWKNV